MSTITKTNRLIIRHFRPEDIDALHTMQSNIEVMRYITGEPKSYNENIAELNKILSDTSEEFNVYAVENADTHEFIGSCGIIANEHNQYEIGYRLTEKHFHKGYGAELLSALIDYCLLTKKYDEITAIVEKDNTFSVRMLDKSPMQPIREYNNDGTIEIEYSLKRTAYDKLI